MTGPSLVQNINIERTLEHHLWDEIGLVRTKITDLESQIAAHKAREVKLLRIAQAADIPDPNGNGENHE